MPSPTYPSLYRAKAVQYDGKTLSAFVPQIFGDQSISIAQVIGEPTGMGWVLFEAGNPAFPVWLNDNSGGSGGGSLVDDAVLDVSGGTGISVTGPPAYPIVSNTGVLGVTAGTNVTVNNTDPQRPIISSTGGGGGTGTDEVWIGPDDPITGHPTIELWVDTDDVGLTDPNTARWNSAWGIVGYAQIIANQTISTAGDVAGLSVTFTPVVGRRYKTTISMLIVAGNTAGIIVPRIFDGTSGNIQQRNYTVGINGYFDASTELIESGLAAVLTVRKANLDLATTTAQVLASPVIPSFFSVEDIGPASLAAPPPTPPSVWVPLPLASGWSTVSTDWGTPRVRLVGDEVQVDAPLITNLTVTTTQPVTIATLPIGYRPSVNRMFVCWVNAVYSSIPSGRQEVFRIDLAPTGVISYQWPYCQISPTTSAVPTAINHINLNQIRFPVS